MNTKTRTRLGKTYDKGSKHNIYDANTVQVGVRMPRPLKRKIQKWCEAHEGIELAEAIRRCLEEMFGKVVLTSDDLFLIAQQTKEQEERDAKKIGL